MTYSDKPATPGELIHFGVKGMHWGVRKDKRPELAPHSGATSRQHEHNRRVYGNKGARNINEQLHKGVSLNKARKDEHARQWSRNKKVLFAMFAAWAAIRLGPALMGSMNKTLSSAAGKRMQANGAKAAANLFADTRGIPSYSTVNVVFDAASNTWG